ncbi:MAG: NAD(P)H-quinone oxidoreductase subunit 4L, chloroplastic [Myxococcota bacterium]|nr:NAD(P)H-quinone oxidoreductase subunit 4L, chloroplastic [Myxococcota bacterium]
MGDLINQILNLPKDLPLGGGGSGGGLFRIGLAHYIALSAILFSVGALGVMIRRNVITVLMSVELMLNAVNVAFIAFNRFGTGIHTQNSHGQIFAFFVMAVAAAEAAVGLAIIINVFRLRETVNVDELDVLKH